MSQEEELPRESTRLVETPGMILEIGSQKPSIIGTSGDEELTQHYETSSCPIMRIPVEILVKVIELSMGRSPTIGRLLDLQLVSRDWYTIMVSTQSFWSRLAFEDGPRAHDLILRRNTSSALDIFLPGGISRPSSENVTPFESLVLPHVARWRGLFGTVFSTSFLEHLRHASTLNKLHIIGVHGESALGTAPALEIPSPNSLRDVSICKLRVIWGSSHLQRLIFLQISQVTALPPPHQFISILVNSPNLEYLGLGVASCLSSIIEPETMPSPVSTNDELQSVGTVHLPRLSIMRISQTSRHFSSALLSMLRAERAEFIEIETVHADDLQETRVRSLRVNMSRILGAAAAVVITFNLHRAQMELLCRPPHISETERARVMKMDPFIMWSLDLLVDGIDMRNWSNVLSLFERGICPDLELGLQDWQAPPVPSAEDIQVRDLFLAFPSTRTFTLYGSVPRVISTLQALSVAEHNHSQTPHHLLPYLTHIKLPLHTRSWDMEDVVSAVVHVVTMRGQIRDDSGLPILRQIGASKNLAVALQMRKEIANMDIVDLDRT